MDERLEKIHKILKIIDQRSLRERVLILITSLAMVYFVWDGLIFSWIGDIKRQLSGNASQLQKKISNLQGQISQVSCSLSLDPVIRLKEKIRKITEESEDLQSKLANMTSSLIPPKEMTSFLQSLLENKSLQIIKVANLSPMPVLGNKKDDSDSDEDEDEDEEENVGMQVYQHGIEIVLNGTFFQILSFLEEAEKMPWKVLWEELEFSITEYPLATIRIVIKTLSINANLLSS